MLVQAESAFTDTSKTLEQSETQFSRYLQWTLDKEMAIDEMQVEITKLETSIQEAIQNSNDLSTTWLGEEGGLERTQDDIYLKELEFKNTLLEREKFPQILGDPDSDAIDAQLLKLEDQHKALKADEIEAQKLVQSAKEEFDKAKSHQVSLNNKLEKTEAAIIQFRLQKIKL